MIEDQELRELTEPRPDREQLTRSIAAFEAVEEEWWREREERQSTRGAPRQRTRPRLHLSAVRENRPRDLMGGMSMRKTTLIKKLTALIEYWPVEAREQLLEAAWSIDGKQIAAAIDRGMGGGQSDPTPSSPA